MGVCCREHTHVVLVSVPSTPLWSAGWSGDLQSLLRAASISAAADGLSDIFDDVDEVVGGAKVLARRSCPLTCMHTRRVGSAQDVNSDEGV
jgi:hypothetical protein